jgi:hypothetical protein
LTRTKGGVKQPTDSITILENGWRNTCRKTLPLPMEEKHLIRSNKLKLESEVPWTGSGERQAWKRCVSLQYYYRMNR